jgi:hypothetical protein
MSSTKQGLPFEICVVLVHRKSGSSARAAIEEGIVPGGGVTLIRAEAALDKLDLVGR